MVIARNVIINGGTIHIEPGQHVFSSCTFKDCSIIASGKFNSPSLVGCLIEGGDVRFSDGSFMSDSILLPSDRSSAGSNNTDQN